MADLRRIDQTLASQAADVLRGRVDSTLRTRMRGLPMLIQTSGLTATAAFLLSRVSKDVKDPKDDPYWRAAKALLDDAAHTAGLRVDDDPRATLTLLARATGERYVLAEARARLLSVWLARLADALYEPEPVAGKATP